MISILHRPSSIWIGPSRLNLNVVTLACHTLMILRGYLYILAKHPFTSE